jgi:hypothetical protein
VNLGVALGRKGKGRRGVPHSNPRWRRKENDCGGAPVIDGGEAPLHEHQQDARKGVRGLTETRSQGKRGGGDVDRGGGGGSELRRGGSGEGLMAGRDEKARVGNGAARQGVVVDNVWLEATVHGRRWFAGVEEGAAVVFGARGIGREEGNAEWDGHEFEKLESRRIEVRRGCSAHMPRLR